MHVAVYCQEFEFGFWLLIYHSMCVVFCSRAFYALLSELFVAFFQPPPLGLATSRAFVLGLTGCSDLKPSFILYKVFFIYKARSSVLTSN